MVLAPGYKIPIQSRLFAFATGCKTLKKLSISKSHFTPALNLHRKT